MKADRISPLGQAIILKVLIAGLEIDRQHIIVYLAARSVWERHGFKLNEELKEAIPDAIDSLRLMFLGAEAVVTDNLLKRRLQEFLEWLDQIETSLNSGDEFYKISVDWLLKYSFLTLGASNYYFCTEKQLKEF